jgi:hypothetical protein
MNIPPIISPQPKSKPLEKNVKEADEVVLIEDLIEDEESSEDELGEELGERRVSRVLDPSSLPVTTVAMKPSHLLLRCYGLPGSKK